MKMSGPERIAALVVGVALLTTATLPKRQTPQVINAAGGVFTSALSTAMGTNKAQNIPA